ncbi:cation diffusion facilitator family transporter [Burkholderia sp. Ch1-1]|uniref:Cation diffusion facilitator family transporter n=1 Tax=Paraburkholderia dioscoreae TaxID=2604047 RepID=A0A5Q4ZD34_9BURK|nr:MULTISPECIES: cation diffusion facilitator family transporter [Paraburkholderia]EIF34261.1 cation diffusion facilitator family transporter [Burkholderia sp. Ch1-1]MDR8400779.1 cation diffusion facilitator family transporter [Paraburkholderia sp. USG1]VVD33189.1 Cation diffusion facilitator family transporter [Paraburkholderia dioscoreae]
MFKAASASALLNAFLSAMQIAIGFMADSDGLFADGVHTLSDLAADSVVLIVLYLTTRHQRAKPRMVGNSADRGIEQALAALFIAAVLTITAVDMLWSSIAQTSTLSGGTALHIGALAVSGFVMLAKEALFRYLRAEGARTGSAILLASAWHARVDAVSALVATLGLAGSLAGMPMLDHIAGAAIGLMIMRMGYTSGRGALKQLFASAPGTAPAGQAAE